MIAKCPSCGVLFETPQKPGASVVCDHCQKNFRVYPFLGDNFTEQAPTKKSFDKKGVAIGTGLLITYILAQNLAKEFPDSFVLNLIDAAITGFLIGSLLGFIPRAIARNNGRTKFGMISQIACALSGTVFGLIGSGAMAFVLTIVALVQKKIAAPIIEFNAASRYEEGASSI